MKVPWEYFPKRDKIVVNHNRGMICAAGEAEQRTFKMYKGQGNRLWLVAVQPNEADNIYTWNESCVKNNGFRGFGGSTIKFPLDTGEVLELEAPWHSNAESFFIDTGVDIRDKYLTAGFVAEKKGAKRKNDYYLDQCVYYDTMFVDAEWTLGTFDRVEEFAKYFVWRVGTPLYYYSF